MGGAKLIYVDEVADLLRAGVSFDQACLRLGVQEDSVITNVRRAERRGAACTDTALVRTARHALHIERMARVYAQRRRGTYL